MHETRDERMRRYRELALKQAEEMSDEEDAAITAAAMRDPDNPPRGHLPDDRLRPAAEAHPDLVEKWRRMQEGLEGIEMSVEVKLILDHDLFLRLEAMGPDWKQRVNKMLRREVGLPPTPDEQPMPAPAIVE